MDLGIPNYKIFAANFRKMGIHDPIKARKLKVKNSKLSYEEKE